MTLVLVLRILITLTFLILAVGGPVSIIMLRRFIIRYIAAQDILQAQVDSISRRVERLENVPLP